MTYDCIMPLGAGSKVGNLEARIAVASLRKFFRGLGRIIIVGEDPGIEGVEVVRCDEPGAVTKDGNIIGKVYRGIVAHPDVSAQFLFVSDDILITKESSWEDFTPRYVDESGIRASDRTWERRIVKTVDRFGEGARFFEPHIFSPMLTMGFLEMCRRYDYMHDEAVTFQSLYYNFIGERGVPVFDHALIKVPATLPDCRHIAYTDRAIADTGFQRQLLKIVEP